MYRKEFQTPAMEAKRLYDLFLNQLPSRTMIEMSYDDTTDYLHQYAKSISILCVEEIMKSLNLFTQSFEWHLEVIEEIKKLKNYNKQY